MLIRKALTFQSLLLDPNSLGGLDWNLNIIVSHSSLAPEIP